MCSKVGAGVGVVVVMLVVTVVVYMDIFQTRIHHILHVLCCIKFAVVADHKDKVQTHLKRTL